MNNCKDCNKRSIEPNCHTYCEEYKSMVKQKQLANKNRKKEIMLNLPNGGYNKHRRRTKGGLKRKR